MIYNIVLNYKRGHEIFFFSGEYSRFRCINKQYRFVCSVAQRNPRENRVILAFFKYYFIFCKSRGKKKTFDVQKNYGYIYCVLL